MTLCLRGDKILLDKIINKGGDRLRKFERKKWLTEIMDEVGIDLTKDNLLIAPIGSGKTYYAINVLMGDQNKKYIYLCDNTNLKKSDVKGREN